MANAGSRGAFNRGLGINKVILPLCLCLVRNWELVPLISRCLEDVLYQYGSRCYNHETIVRDWERRARRFFLTVFDMVNLFGHPWIFPPPIRHGLLESHDANIIDSPNV